MLPLQRLLQVELKTARINSLRLLLIILLAPLIACDGSSNGPKPNDVPGLSPSINTSPDNKNDGWIVSTAVNEGFDEAAITSILTSIRDGAYPGVDSVVMAKNGMLVAEAYYNGYGPDTLHDLRSTSKSITSALAGVAIEEGVLELNHTLDDLILNLGEYDNPDEKKSK